VSRSGGAVAASALGALALSACTMTPSEVDPSPEPTPLVEPIVNIGANGVSPQILHISADTVITFVNRDSRAHELRSDPHPAHTECALMNLGPIAAGASRDTVKIVSGQGCGYHAEGDPASRSFQGFVLAH
jgi:plastocyanin